MLVVYVAWTAAVKATGCCAIEYRSGIRTVTATVLTGTPPLIPIGSTFFCLIATCHSSPDSS